MSNQLHDLSESLHRRASQVSPESLPDLTVVRRRAGQIRRRRIALGTGAALGLTAVAAPLAWQLAGPGESAQVPPAKQPVATDTAAPSPGPAPSGARTGMDLRNLPTGNDVGIGWASREGVTTTLHPTSGGAFDVEVPAGESLQGFATLADGRTVGATQKHVLVWDKQGSLLFDEATPTGSLAVDRTHRNVAWADDAGRARVLVSGADDPQTLVSAKTVLTRAVAIDSSAGDCTPTQDAQQACSVAFNTTERGPVVVTSAGTVTSPYGGDVGGTTLADISDLWRPENGIGGTVAGRDDASGCGDLVALESEPGEPTCDRQYGTISPDGTQVTLVDDAPRGDNGAAPAADRIGVFTLYEQRPTWLRTPGTTGSNAEVVDSVWAGDTDVVALVRQDGNWSLVRFDAEGGATRVAPQVEQGQDTPPYALEIQP